jgi:CDP-glucose 4,6-dehydratase
MHLILRGELGASKQFAMGVWQNKRVILTGHTGFKGGWLSIWLKFLGAQVTGLSLPALSPSFYEAVGLAGQYPEKFSDIRDLEAVKTSITEADPEVIIHMAAQPLVRASYADPIETYTTNVMGTANVLEAARSCRDLQAVLVITTDKVYRNDEKPAGYREEDALGGDDPYSASKACAELVSASYRESFFSKADSPLIATARSGNVIGGGDWGEDRLVPDMIRALSSGQPVQIRAPNSVRPWQHVLDPLQGYLQLTEQLVAGNAACAGPWNFGPRPSDFQSVGAVVAKFADQWGPDAAWEADEGHHVKETKILSLDPTKAMERLAWKPRLSLDDSVRLTVEWHKQHQESADVLAVSLTQIEAYQAQPD